jgi:PadR family transcriptional regulator, regulatory protein PadR
MFYIMEQMNTTSLGEFELAVLVSLVALDDAYGASIRREVSRRLGRDCTVGAVYTTLQRLEDKALITSWTSDSTPVRGGRARRCYSLTPRGNRAMRHAAEIREQLWKGVKLGMRTV